MFITLANEPRAARQILSSFTKRCTLCLNSSTHSVKNNSEIVVKVSGHYGRKHIHVTWWDWEESPLSPMSPSQGHISQCFVNKSPLSRSTPLLHKHTHLSPQPHTPSSSPSSPIWAAILHSRCRSSLRWLSVRRPNTACC